MNKKLVSIIIPCYNVEKFIINALDSIFVQEYQNVEVLCINDGSLDKTMELINKYKKNNNKVKLITKENGGVSSARNVGLDNATGDYILFLDADDQFGPNCIKILVEAVENNNVDTAFGFWSINKEDLNLKEKVSYNKLNQTDIVHSFMYKPKPNSFFNFLYKKELIKNNGIRFDTDIKYGEDNLFFWKYVCHIKNGIFVNSPLYWYFQNECSVMHNFNWSFVDTAISIQRASKYIESNFKTVSNEFNNYMIARTYFSIAMQFAKHRQKDLYIEFCKQYRVKNYAKMLINKNGIILTICSSFLRLSPSLFYLVCKFL